MSRIQSTEHFRDKNRSMISKLFINRPILAIVIAIITVMAASLQCGDCGAQFPEIIPPQILVSTTFTGADAVPSSSQWPRLWSNR